MNPYVIPGLPPRDIDGILKLTAEAFGVTVEQIKSADRHRDIVQARQAFCDLARRQTGASFQAIARKINRDHSTVIHAISVVSDRIFARDKDFCVYYEKLERMIK